MNENLHNTEKVKEAFKTSRKLRYKLYKSRIKKELTINKYQTELDTWDSLGFPSIEELDVRLIMYCKQKKIDKLVIAYPIT